MKHWVKNKVIDFCYVTDFVANGSFASLRENVTYINSPDYAVLVRLTDFTKKWSKDFVYVSKASYNFLKKSSLFPNDLIMSNVGEPGIVFLVPDLKQPMTLGPNSILIRPNSNSSTSKFLFLYFLSEKGRKQIDHISTGAAQKKFNKTSFRDLEILLPPLIEQQRIIAILDEAFAAIDKAKANAEKNLQNTKELFESYLQNVFTNPGEDWEKKKLNQISENLDSKRIPITKNLRKSGKYPYYGASGIVDYVADYIFDGDYLLVSEDGANLLARTYPIAFPITGRTWVNNHAHILRFENLNSQRFLEYYLNSIKLDDYVSGMAQPKLNQSMLNSIPIPYPGLEIQKSIVGKLDILSTETNKLEAIYQQKLNDLEELKKSILQKTFNGKLTAKQVTV